MPALKPQTWFLLRGSAWMAGLLLLWWFGLMNPLLYIVRETAEVCGSVMLGASSRWITETAGGDWTLEVPIEAAIPDPSGQPAAMTRIHSIDFDLARTDAAAFTFGLPVFWALMLAAPGLRRSLRPLILGTLVMTAADIVLLLIFAELFAHKTVAQWTGSSGAVASWGLRFGEYLTVNVIPYVAPFVSALWLHRELRRQILELGAAPSSDRHTTPPSPLRAG